MRVLLLGILALTASLASAQQAQFPYCYLWGDTFSSMPANASQMVKVRQVSGLQPGEAVAEAIQRVIAQTVPGPARTTDPQHIAIVLHNFGSNDPGSATSFYDVGDELTSPAPVFVSPTPEPFWPFMQPWMTEGIEKVQTWMIDFCNLYPTEEDYRPIRFHFDVESPAAACCDIDHVRIAQAVSLDRTRWLNKPVPGFGTPNSPVFMEDLFVQAVDNYGWQPGRMFHELLNGNERPGYVDNRQYMLWYYSVCQRAMDGAMNEAVYKILKLRWPQAELKVSNYEHINADGKEDDFGWYYGRDLNQSPAIVTKGVRGGTTTSPEGALNYWVTDSPPNQPTKHRLWLVQDGTASGDFSAPVLYLHHPIFAAIPEAPNCDVNPLAINPYLPPHVGQNELTIYDASLFVHRRTIEGILNSEVTGNDPSKIAPWVLGPGTGTARQNLPSPPPPPFCQTTNLEYLSDQIAMLRAKKVSEILLWWDDTVPSNTWIPFQRTIEEVCSPWLLGAWISYGTPITPTEFDRVRYTLRPASQSGIGETIDATSMLNGKSQVVDIIGSFIGTDNASSLRFYLECAVTDPSVRGKVYVFNPNHFPSPDWEEVPIDDFGPQESGFGFFAPIDPPNLGNEWYRTRRVFANVPNKLDGEPGERTVLIKVTLRREDLEQGPFLASFDLLQVAGTFENGGETDGDAQGGDFDYSGTVEPTDMAAFLSAWLAMSPAADQNGDGIINAADVAIFLQKYSQ